MYWKVQYCKVQYSNHNSLIKLVSNPDCNLQIFQKVHIHKRHDCWKYETSLFRQKSFKHLYKITKENLSIRFQIKIFTIFEKIKNHSYTYYDYKRKLEYSFSDKDHDNITLFNYMLKFKISILLLIIYINIYFMITEENLSIRFQINIIKFLIFN